MQMRTKGPVADTRVQWRIQGSSGGYRELLCLAETPSENKACARNQLMDRVQTGSFLDQQPSVQFMFPIIIANDLVNHLMPT